MPNTIASLALLKAFAESNRSYMDLFVPIAAEVISRSREDVISVSVLQEQMKLSFGLQIPQHALETILAKARAAGYLEHRDGAYYRVSKALAQLDFRSTQQDIVAKYEALVSSICDYARSTFKHDLSKADAEAALLSFLDQYGIDIVERAYGGNPIPESPQADKGARVIVSDYLQVCSREHSTHLQFFETVAKGLMLANSVFLPDPGKFQKRFRNTTVYIDTPLLVFALGYAGLPRQTPVREMLSMCREFGAELCCFMHTLEEARGILDACVQIIKTGRFSQAWGPSVEYFLTQGANASDIERYSIRMERDLRALGIQVDDKPPYLVRHNVDEKALEGRLQQALRYRREIALQRDVDSVAAIIRARRGLHSQYVEDSRAIFVTANRALVQVSRSFFKDAERPYAVPPCITDVTLTNILWLKKPLSLPDLPMKRIIADTYAAVQPSDELWHRFTSEVEKLQAGGEVTSDELVLLRYSSESRRVLMELTLGREEAFTQGTVKEILVLVRDRIRMDLQQELGNVQAARASLAQELRDKEDQENQRQVRLRKLGRKRGKILSLAICVVFFGLFLSGGTFSILTIKGALLVQILVGGLQFVVAVFSALSLVFGTTIKRWLRRLETRVEERYLSRFS